ncbi:hypothetical protein Cni_G15932 [Canna indica]|uniref:Uncharacterized protein n=1 Tax=Canna indica TaxID=4628 RepID=A0AAQ3KEA7_9LILI|nr:hypothetical protein Cni_G15932 [Canna indica]
MTMKLQECPLPHMVVFLLLMLVAGPLSSPSHARIVSRELQTYWKTESSKTSVAYFPRISPSQEPVNDDLSSLSGVSKRMVPQGPNPLHN